MDSLCLPCQRGRACEAVPAAALLPVLSLLIGLVVSFGLSVLATLLCHRLQLPSAVVLLLFVIGPTNWEPAQIS